jgi:signal transduction histidine kinase
VLGLVGLLDQTGLNEEQRAITAHMRGSGETLLVLINDLLDVTKAAEGKLLLDPTAVDVAELTGEVAALFHPLAATKGLSVDWRCDDALPARVFVDGHRLKQVLSNLLSNAIKFTEHGGIRLEACVDRTAEGERVVFRLEDDGMGIAHPDRVWEAFEQDNARIAREHGGTGLGLTVVRHLVALLGGEIAVHSRVGIGTTFEFWIPARAVPAGLDAPEPAAMGDVSSLAVLVADDSPVNQLIARGLLER